MCPNLFKPAPGRSVPGRSKSTDKPATATALNRKFLFHLMLAGSLLIGAGAAQTATADDGAWLSGDLEDLPAPENPSLLGRVAQALSLKSDEPPVSALTITPNSKYEAWLSDQGNSQGITAEKPDGTHGGIVRIYQGADLDRNPPLDRPLNLDVTKDLFPDALAQTGAHVSRIHGILPSPDHKTMALNFVASGHLGIVQGDSKRPVCLFRTTGTPTGRQNHMSFWTPDGQRLIIANQNGRFLERVNVVRQSLGHLPGNVIAYVYDANASLDLVGGPGRVTAQPVAVDLNPNDGISCELKGQVKDNQPVTTPNGQPKQAPDIRPNNTIICPIAARNGRHVFATLLGGGLFVVDVKATPISIVAEYDKSVVTDSGCGGIESKGFMHINTGTNPTVAGKSGFSIYRFQLDQYPKGPKYLKVNTPAPKASFNDPDNGKIAGAGKDLPPGTNRDAHGLVLIKRSLLGSERYLHQFDRVRNNVEVFRLAPPWNQFRHEATYDLTSKGVCGGTVGTTKTNDPTPDLVDLAVVGPHAGKRIYVALRGPFPTTVAHAADGSCPGLGIVTLSPKGDRGELTQVLPASITNFTGTKNISDPHAAIIRLK